MRAVAAGVVVAMVACVLLLGAGATNVGFTQGEWKMASCAAHILAFVG